MKKLSMLLLIPIFIAGFFAFSPMTDDPTVDHVPLHLLKNNNPVVYMPMATITIDDYDNFSMGVDYSEGHISMNPKNPLQTINAWNITSFHYSNDGGLNWSNNTPPFPSSAGDPVTAYDSLGNAYYETMKSPITGCWVAKSTNNGQSWISANVTAVSGNDKNWIACDQTGGPYANYVYSIMTQSGTASFWRSTNLGASFTQTASLTPHSYPGAMVCVGANGGIQGGAVLAATHLGPNSSGTYTFHLSTNGGASFTTKSSVQWTGYIGTEISGRSTVNGMRTRPYPMIAGDNSFGPYRGRFYCVYATNNPPGNGNKSDIFLRYTTDQGSTWSSPVVVNDDPNSQNNFQFFPAIWCEKETGKLYIKWYDTRNCPTSDSMDVYATYTTNGGATFAPNQRVTNKIFKTKISSSGNPPAYQGDYDAITANNKVGMALWADFRNNNYGSFTAYFPDYAMRLNPLQDSINSVNGSVYVRIVIPSTKLYTDSVFFQSAVTPSPSSGTFSITYPGGPWVKSCPDSAFVKVTANNVTAGTYILTVKGLGSNGTPVHVRTMTLVAGSTVTSVTGNEGGLTYRLEQNYPNPFNPTTKITFSILKQSDVKITIYDVTGKKVTEIFYPNQMAGTHNAVFNARGLGAGVYFYKLEADGFTDVKKMLLIK